MSLTVTGYFNCHITIFSRYQHIIAIVKLISSVDSSTLLLSHHYLLQIAAHCYYHIAIFSRQQHIAIITLLPEVDSSTLLFSLLSSVGSSSLVLSSHLLSSVDSTIHWTIFSRQHIGIFSRQQYIGAIIIIAIFCRQDHIIVIIIFAIFCRQQYSALVLLSHCFCTVCTLVL